MARPYRLQSEDCFYHITSRGNDRKKVFLNDTDFEKFLEYILTAKGKYDFYLLAYVLMSNYYHLLIKTTKPNLSKIMHYINGFHTTYFNIKRGKTGHLFQGRYKSLVIDADSYFQEFTRYIHLNPIRAKMVENPGDYKWSSYKAYIGRKRKDAYIDKQEIHKYLDMTGGSYKLFVDRMSGEEDNIFKDVYGGFLLGRVGFIKEKLKELKTQVESDEISCRKRLMEENRKIRNQVKKLISIFQG